MNMALAVTDGHLGTAPSAPHLAVRNLEVVYHRVVTAVQNVSLDVSSGRVVVILGTNGAGKTTVLRAISGFIEADDAEITHGTIEFEGRRIEGKPPDETTRLGIVLVPERRKIFETLSVRENLEVAMRGRDRGRLAQVYDRFPILYERRNQTGGYLSGGERQMLAIAAALLCDARLLMVDELSLGLAPRIVADLFVSLHGLSRELAISVVLVEQNARAALEVADYGYILESGRVVFSGTPEQLKSHQDVAEFYLGIGGQNDKSYRDVKQYRRKRRWWG
jgi:branched-chain amino acid transport system ATP-binding protein